MKSIFCTEKQGGIAAIAKYNTEVRERALTTTSNNSGVYIFEDEFGYITSDGRLIQRDNSYFKGRELAVVPEGKSDEVVSYYQKAFDQLNTYVEKQLSLLKSESESEQKEALDRLTREIREADAMGNFDELLSKVNVQLGGGQTEIQENGQSTEGVDSADQSESVDEAPEDTEAEQPQQPEAETEDSEKEETENTAIQSEEVESGESEETTDEEYSEEGIGYYRKITEEAEKLAEQTDMQTVQHEFENLKFKWQEGAEIVEELQEEYDALNSRFKEAEASFRQRKEEYYQQQREKREKNLQQREQLLEKMRQLVKEEKWNAFNEVKQIQAKWEKIKNLPAEEAQKQQEEFDRLFSTFEGNKVDYLVEKRQKEEDNLTGKLVLLDKLEEVVKQAGPDTDSWKQLDEDIEQLNRHWKKIGKVPKEQADQIWNRYRTLLDEYYNRKYQHNEEYRKELDKNVKERERLCEEAEKLKDEEDLALAARKVNQLHKQWKKTGPVPQEKNEELWQRFKTASDEFNQFKQEHLDTLKEQEQKNLEQKLELCEKAEEVRDSEDWDNGADKMNALMEQWKEIGPAPRRKAGKVWKRFKKAMDDYFERRREHFRQIRKEQKENYRKKREIVEQITQLAERDDIQEALAEAKKLQEQFKSIGFVPIKKKDKIWKDYKEACDLIYGKAREDGAIGGKGDAGQGEPSSEAHRVQKEINKLRKECDRLNDEIVRFSDTKTFIKPNKKGIQLREEIQQKIEAAEAKLKEKNERIEQLRRELEDVED